MGENITLWSESWGRLGDVAIGAVYFYVAIVLLVRLLGKRLTSQMNNFDWIVTIAIGGLMGSGILLRDVSLIDSTLAILILGGMQWLTTFFVRKSEILTKIAKPSPTLLVHKGEFITENLAKERVSEAEIRSCLRERGYTSLDDANWVIIETDGKLTVIPKSDTDLREAELMSDVSRPQNLV